MSLQIHILVFLLFCCSLGAAEDLELDSLLRRPATALALNTSVDNARYQQINSAPHKEHLRYFGDRDILNTVNFVSNIVEKMRRLETNLGWADVSVKAGTPSHGQVLEAQPDTEALHKGKHAIIASKATMQMMYKYCTSHMTSTIDCVKSLSNIRLVDKASKRICSEMNKPCTEREIYSKYRSIDGSCNNPYERSRGQALTGYKRLLFPDYMDGVQEPRSRSVHKHHCLPSARLVSSKLIKHDNDPDDSRTMMVAQWSQFIAHDMSHTVSSKTLHTDKSIKCCTTSGRKLAPRYQHPFCAPIDVADNDKVYSKHGLKCMSYVRSVSAIRPSCTLGPLEQLNQATHFLDASQIYGSDQKRANQLRLMRRGMLKISDDNKGMFLPTQNDAKSLPLHFISGDSRANTLPGLTALHTVWLREHNSIAQKLHALNPTWNDEILYQEARRIVIAEMQHITYNEWLPTILGKEYTWKLNTPVDESTFGEDVSVSNSFATAAMRFEKSLLDNYLHLYHHDNRILNGSIRVQDYFNKPEFVQGAGNLDAILRGLVTQSSRKANLNFGSDVTSQVYNNGKYGYDIVSLDIQRGRDHGLPSYTAYRSLCGLPEVKTFDDLGPEIPKNVIDEISKVYRDPHDVDLLIGGLAETPRHGSVVGPTFSCIISDQFLRTKFGDRYFYDHLRQPKPFTAEQLAEIKQTTLAKVLCDNAGDIKMIQRDVFKQISPNNPVVSCDKMRHLNNSFLGHIASRFG